VGDPRIREFCENVFDLAGAYLDAMPMRHQTVALGTRTVLIHTPDIPNQAGIEPLDGLIAITPPPPTADFEITCVDACGPISLPWGTWPSTWHGPLGTVPARFSVPFRLALDRHTQTISIFHPGLGRGVVWMWDYSLLPYWAAATPWRLMFSWCADTFDAEMIHAACVTKRDEAVLLVGRSGAGKSTLALQAAESGWGLIGDDFILIQDTTAYPVYTRAKAHDSTLTVLEQPWTVINNDAPDQKKILDISTHLETKSRLGRPIRSAVAPTQSDRSHLREITGGQALLKLAPYSLSGLLGGNSRSLVRMRRLLASMTAFQLDVARDKRSDLAALGDAWQAGDD